jgi:hypothetical protein
MLGPTEANPTPIRNMAKVREVASSTNPRLKLAALSKQRDQKSNQRGPKRSTSKPPIGVKNGDARWKALIVAPICVLVIGKLVEIVRNNGGIMSRENIPPPNTAKIKPNVKNA